VQNIQEADGQLRDAVIRQLEWDPQITSQDIGVAISDSVVTLTGFVHSYAEKYAAEQAAKSVYGVRVVANEIEVQPRMARTDPEIARDVAQVVRLDVTLPGDGIRATVQDGFVTLEGTVEWHYQRARVEAVARNIPGVRGVINHIAIQPRQPSTLEVLHDIEDALRRSAEVDARQIAVSAKDGRIHLYGKVRSWVERDQAEHAAWAAPGVTEVINDISVVPG